MKSNKLILLGGVGRSGTSISARLLGSARDTEYFYEPPVPFYLVDKIEDYKDVKEWKTLFNISVYKDLLKASLAGRNLNLNPHDSSSVWKSKTREEVEYRHSKSFSQFEIFDKAKDANVVVKLLDNMRNYHLVKKNAPEVKGIVILRNPKDTINSLYRKNWFSNEQLHKTAPEPAREMEIMGEWRVHSFLKSEQEISRWFSMSEIERVCYYYTWHTNRFYEITEESDLLVFSYDNFLNNTSTGLECLLTALGLEAGLLTSQILSSIKPSKAITEDFIASVSKKDEKEMFQAYNKLYSKSINNND